MIRGQKAQGDVLLSPVDEQGNPIEGPPEGAKRVRGRTLAFGEVTGHHHSFTQDVEMYEKEGDPRKWVLLKEEEILDHQEHGELTFDPGWYVFDGQVEADPFTGLSRRVRD